MHFFKYHTLNMWKTLKIKKYRSASSQNRQFIRFILGPQGPNSHVRSSDRDIPMVESNETKNWYSRVRSTCPGSKIITKRRPNGVQKKTWSSFLVAQKAIFCITYVRFYGNFLLSEWRLIGNVFRLSKCQRIVIVYQLPIR